MAALVVGWFVSNKIRAAILATVLFCIPAAAQPAGDMDAYIKSRSPETRATLIENYLAGRWIFDRVLKYRNTPSIYVSCPKEGCVSPALHILEFLQSNAPDTFGARIAQADAAQIEVHIAPRPDTFDQRDRKIDGKLHLDANITSKKLLKTGGKDIEFVDAPCWAVSYFDKYTGVIEKSLIFIDSDSSPREQYSCMGFELVRAAGVVSTLNIVFYRKFDTTLDDNVSIWLAANAYLHGLPDIKAGDPMEKVQRILSDRYDVKN
ncbi:hypothetical protein [Taklimakanibacter lacteus]|uniref:hypothetical protein n=1 Tax=Taklimakanibacter lacteus TaxID=2268456 RepID=UPI000E6634E8